MHSTCPRGTTAPCTAQNAGAMPRGKGHPSLRLTRLIVRALQILLHCCSTSPTQNRCDAARCGFQQQSTNRVLGCPPDSTAQVRRPRHAVRWKPPYCSEAFLRGRMFQQVTTLPEGSNGKERTGITKCEPDIRVNGVRCMPCGHVPDKSGPSSQALQKKKCDAGYFCPSPSSSSQQENSGGPLTRREHLGDILLPRVQQPAAE